MCDNQMMGVGWGRASRSCSPNFISTCHLFILLLRGFPIPHPRQLPEAELFSRLMTAGGPAQSGLASAFASSCSASMNSGEFSQ